MQTLVYKGAINQSDFYSSTSFLSSCWNLSFLNEQKSLAYNNANAAIKALNIIILKYL